MGSSEGGEEVGSSEGEKKWVVEEVGSSEGGEEVGSSEGEKKWVVVRGRRSG